MKSDDAKALRETSSAVGLSTKSPSIMFRLSRTLFAPYTGTSVKERVEVESIYEPVGDHALWPTGLCRIGTSVCRGCVLCGPSGGGLSNDEQGGSGGPS